MSSSEANGKKDEDLPHGAAASGTRKKSVASATAVKSRRKISLPWFRQSSFGMSLARLRLPKQHTIATSDEAEASAEKAEALPVLGEVVTATKDEVMMVLNIVSRYGPPRGCATEYSVWPQHFLVKCPPSLSASARRLY
jgi:hypothetical protein